MNSDEVKIKPGYGVLIMRREGGVDAFVGPMDQPSRFGKNCKTLRHIVRHSPDGFEYGYGGSGPHDLALSLLHATIGTTLADVYYNKFTDDIVSKVRRESTEWYITHERITAWVDKVADHRWAKRTITKGRDAGADLPERCGKCGSIRRPDGRSAPCRKGRYFQKEVSEHGQ